MKSVNPVLLIAAVLLGALLAYMGMWLLGSDVSAEKSGESDEKKPIYWVAPMDANYTRDKPGKSPMGMDLIPVYADGAGGSDSGPGTIKISPEVVNNLGVRTVIAGNRQLHSRISTVGYVQYDEDQMVHIHPRVEGWIEKLYVKAEGDPVKKNQALYEIYSPALVNAQEELLLGMDRNNLRLIKAAEDRLKALQLPAAAIKKLKRTKKVAQNITFYAPQSGVLDNLSIREGFFVQPGTTLMSIAKLDQVWVEAEVFAIQASLVKKDLPVTMTHTFQPGREWLGKIDYIYPTLNDKTRTLKVRLRFENNDHALKPNMFAQVIIHTRTEQEPLMVPKEAVIRTGVGDRVVLALGEGRYKSIDVKVGRYDADSAEILYGLDAGDEIVSSAQFLLDSESSKTSDFKRMNYDTNDTTDYSSVWVEATINSVMVGHKMVNVSHDAIADWDWPEMTMDFTASAWIDLEALKEGETLQIELEKNSDGDVKIIDYRSANTADDAPDSATVHGTINSIMTGHRMLNISRGAIEKWGRPAATLDFISAEDVDLSQLSKGMEIEFTFHMADGNFVISDIQLPTNERR